VQDPAFCVRKETDPGAEKWFRTGSNRGGERIVSIRERLEIGERDRLSPWACLSASSTGRARPEAECPFRTAFQRDRDRILHAKAFRRLKHKTQVFLNPEGDHYRTRLTHTLEVAQIARTIARALWLNEDLAEAIALGHDLGHTPFGHAGERVLDSLLPGGFRHQEQSLRVVDVLEGGTGLNLTHEVRDGIHHHSGDRRPSTLEGQAVYYADRIAYINHDLDDALRAGLLAVEDLPRDCLAVLGDTHSQRIATMVGDIIAHSQGRPALTPGTEVWAAADRLRDYLFAHVYGSGSRAKGEERKAQLLLEQLYQHYLAHPELVYEGRKASGATTLERAIGDYLAGMTDRFAVAQYLKFFVPDNWR
jgi:dGTPase